MSSSAIELSPTSMRFLACALILSLPPVNLNAQDHSAHNSVTGSATTEDMAAFLASARAGTEKYRDRSVAIAAGFRRLGRDFPSMGEHWANPGKVIAGRFSIADPAMLTYATIDGRPILLGLVYAIPLEAGQLPPLLPGGSKAWHEHNGTVDEESFLPEHGGDHSSMHVGGTRLAILHVWTILPNPAGYFAAENWALPFARLHLEAGPTISEPAARALSLVSGSGDFYANLIESELSSAAGDESRRALTAATASATAVVSSRERKDALSPLEISELERIWRRFAALIAERNPALGRRLSGETHDGDVR